jgi:hypothetical protein
VSRRRPFSVAVDLLVAVDLARPRIDAALDLRLLDGRRVAYPARLGAAIGAVKAGLDVVASDALDGDRRLAKRGLGRERRRLERLAPKLPDPPRGRIEEAIAYLGEAS